MRYIALFAGILLAACLASPSASKADGYPWCAHYGFDMAGTNCGFVSFQQCQASLSGNGGYCAQNLQYQGPYLDSTRRPRRAN